MTGIAILQTSASVLQKSAEMAEKDPHGVIITLVSVSVVFVALIVLYFAYFHRKSFIREDNPSQEKASDRKQQSRITGPRRSRGHRLGSGSGT